MIMKTEESTTKKVATLYERLGGEAGLRKIVNDVLDYNAANPRIGHYFQNMSMSMDQLKESVFNFFSMGIGGPHQYNGKDMVAAHKGLDLSARDFDLANDDTIEALQANGVPQAEIDEVISILDSMRGDVIGK